MNNKKQIVDALKASGLVEDTGASVKPYGYGGGGEFKPTLARAFMSEKLNECRAEFEKWAREQWIPGRRTVDGETYTTVTMRSAWDAWQAAWNRRAVPEGWQLVPKEPTPEMLDAGGELIWRDMLAAAPEHAPYGGARGGGKSRQYAAVLAAAPKREGA